MWTSLVLLTGTVAVLGTLGVGSAPADPPASAAAKPMTKDELVSRGKYLVNFGGCNDCHTPKIMTDKGPMPDMSRELSGHPEGKAIPVFTKEQVAPGNWSMCNEDMTAWVGLWGVSYAANLTPDQNSGIGLWTEDMFMKAMASGKHMGAGRPILPPMPWMYIASLTADDQMAIFAYLKSIKPINNTVPAPVSLADHFGANK
jgi:hypothetical protein